MIVASNPFDTEIFGVRVGRAELSSPADVDPLLSAALAVPLDVVFARALADSPVVSALERRGHTPLETLVTSTWRPGATLTSTRSAVIEHHPRVDETDAAAIAAITVEAISISHFHADPRLPLERTHRLYAAWARNDATGRAQRTIVAREGGAIVGYITVLVRDDTAVIDLIAVDPRRQGRGIGGALLASFLEWAQADGLGARVGTQSNNPALDLYQRFGFVPTERQVTYHLWLV